MTFIWAQCPIKLKKFHIQSADIFQLDGRTNKEGDWVGASDQAVAFSREKGDVGSSSPPPTVSLAKYILTFFFLTKYATSCRLAALTTKTTT